MTALAHYEGLERLPNLPFRAYASPELLPAAGNIATRFDQARRFFNARMIGAWSTLGRRLDPIPFE